MLTTEEKNLLLAVFSRYQSCTNDRIDQVIAELRAAIAAEGAADIINTRQHQIDMLEIWVKTRQKVNDLHDKVSKL